MPVVAAFRCQGCGAHRSGGNIAVRGGLFVCADECIAPEARCRCICCTPHCEPEACAFMLGQRREKKATSTISYTSPVDKLPRVW